MTAIDVLSAVVTVDMTATDVLSAAVTLLT